MKRCSRFTLAAVACAAALAATQSTQGGGIILYEIATPDVGLASAGYASRADDASTLFKNPAGMSQLQGSQVQGGLQALYGSVSFTPNGNTSPLLGNDDGGNAVGLLPGASLFVVTPIGEKVRVGLGMLSYFGLAQDYNDNWVGRYYVQKSALVGMTLTPSVSYEATDWLSVGAGLNAMYGLLETDIAVNRRFINPLLDDGQMTLSDRTWGFGANLGVLIKAGEKTRIGLTYLSAVDLDFSDTPSFANFTPASPSTLNLGTKVPQSAMLSVYRTLNEQWALMADCGWQNWSQFGYVQAGVEGGATTTLNQNYQDTWHGAIGAQYRPTEKWQLSGGVAFDSSAVNSENRTVTLPMCQTWRFGLGAQYQLSRAVNVGAACTFMWAGDMSVNQTSALPVAAGGRGNVSGSFDNTWFTIANVNLNWKF
jgi:long-chain fatty acid transport protein